jgi:hypothetical protein
MEIKIISAVLNDEFWVFRDRHKGSAAKRGIIERQNLN